MQASRQRAASISQTRGSSDLPPFFHGAINKPDPSAAILTPCPFFFKYTIPIPAVLSTIADPAAEPTPVNSLVASDGTTLLQVMEQRCCK